MPSKTFDAIFKNLVESGPNDWPVFVGQPAAPTQVIDADIATVSGAADKVLRVETAVPYLLHLEFVAGHDAARLPRLLHVRNALLENRHDLPVRSVVVLLRPEADSPALTGTRSQGFPGEEPYDWFRYQVIRLWQMPVQPLLEGGPAVLPLAPISAVTEAELPGIIKRMEKRLRQPALRSRARESWAAAFILMGMRYSSALAESLLRGVVTMEESTTYQLIIERGKAAGAIEEARRVLVRVGSGRFGPPDRRTVRALEKITDVERLEDLIVQLAQVNSWQELLPPARRTKRNGRT